jgi:hypothetical protein
MPEPVAHSKPKKITACRMCNSKSLVPILGLGNQYLTGVFPKEINEKSLTRGPLSLVKCHDGPQACGLLQLEHSYPVNELYGSNYGYRSGLNVQMVNHLLALAREAKETAQLDRGDFVIDIGSNDGTLLGNFNEDLLLLGIDPSAEKFRHFYRDDIRLIVDFFSSEVVKAEVGTKKAKLITSIAMMYDLENPTSFATEVASVLHPEGVWVFEQSYMPLMIQQNSFDTICHEHIEYYGLKQIQWMLNAAGLQVIKVSLNDANGGSFRVYASHRDSKRHIVDKSVGFLEAQEQEFTSLLPYTRFEHSVVDLKEQLQQFLLECSTSGKSVHGLGASTKGNVLLQYVGATSKVIQAIGDVNPDKFGCVTPGTWIQIVSEKSSLQANADIYIVLPWHFRQHFVTSSRYQGRTLCFPLPRLEVVSL